MEPASESADLYEFGSYTADPLTRLLRRGNTPISLSPKVFDTLLYLLENANQLISKDRLMAALWPDRVVEEGNLTQNIFTLRKVLNESGEERYIVTAPGRGYRFAVPVRRVRRVAAATSSPATSEVSPQLVALTPPSALTPAPTPRQWHLVRIAMIAVAFALIALAVYRLEHSQGSTAITARSRILLIDFVNTTQNPPLGDVAGKVLSIGLSQSPFLDVIPPQQIGKTLTLMEKRADTPLTSVLALEVCLRNRGRAMLGGTVANSGAGFLVMLEAFDCSSGDRVAQGKMEAKNISDVPRAVDRLALKMRTQLGESLASIQKFDVPIEQATTNSFDALKAYSAGVQSQDNGDHNGAVLLFKRATELDPSFALAYASLAGAYVSLREPDLARQNYQKAYGLKDRVSEKEKLWISAEYFKLVGNLEESINSYHAIAKLYPADGQPWTSLGDLYTRMARYQDAVEAAKQGLSLNPESIRAYNVLTRAFKRSNRFAEAMSVGRQATAKGLDDWSMHCMLFEIAFALGDSEQMSEQASKEARKPNEGWMLNYEAWAAATVGQLKRSRELFERAIARMQANGGNEHSLAISTFYTDYMQMLSQFGLEQEARQLVARAPALEQNDDAAFVLARIGLPEKATMLDRTFRERYPDSSVTNDLTRPRGRAAIALSSGAPGEAIALLQPSLPSKLRTPEVPSLLGEAYLLLGKPEEAASEFNDILNNRGVDAISPLFPLAYLGLARAMSMQGNVAKSREAYERLFAFWKDSDADNPILLRARAEYTRLSHDHAN